MKFFLTIYVCSIVAGKCFVAPGYPKEQTDYYDCVRNGLSESYEILYQEDFTRDDVVANRLYPKFSCEKVILPKKKPKIEQEAEQPTSLSFGTIVRGIFRLASYSIN